MKKIIAAVVAAVTLILWGGRVWYVNARAEKPVHQSYPMNEFVPLGGNFTMDSTENLEGYEVMVTGVSVKTYEEYVTGYGETADYLPQGDVMHHVRPVWVYDVALTVKNGGNTEGAVDLFNFKVQTYNEYLQVHEELWELAQPNLEGSLSFKLRENTEMEFHVPFVLNFVNEKQLGLHFLTHKPFWLVVNEYPVKQMITLQ